MTSTSAKGQRSRSEKECFDKWHAKGLEEGKKLVNKFFKPRAKHSMTTQGPSIEVIGHRPVASYSRTAITFVVQNQQLKWRRTTEEPAVQ